MVTSCASFHSWGTSAFLQASLMMSCLTAWDFRVDAIWAMWFTFSAFNCFNDIGEFRSLIHPVLNRDCSTLQSHVGRRISFRSVLKCSVHLESRSWFSGSSVVSSLWPATYLGDWHDGASYLLHTWVKKKPMTWTDWKMIGFERNYSALSWKKAPVASADRD